MAGYNKRDSAARCMEISRITTGASPCSMRRSPSRRWSATKRSNISKSIATNYSRGVVPLIGVGIGGHRRRHWVAEQLRGVFPGDLADGIGRKAGDRFKDDLLRVGPGRVEVGIVGLNQQVLGP